MRAFSTTAFTLMTGFGLIGVSGGVSLVHARDPLDGHRLFFTAAQRTDALLTMPSLPPGSLPDASVQALADTDVKRVSGAEKRASEGSVDPLNKRQVRAPTPRQEGGTNDYQVYFTGLVTGRREARILVNGLPCESASAAHNSEADRPVLINCHGVRNDGLILTVSIASAELVVTDSAGHVHHLLPGEGM